MSGTDVQTLGRWTRLSAREQWFPDRVRPTMRRLAAAADELARIDDSASFKASRFDTPNGFIKVPTAYAGEARRAWDDALRGDPRGAADLADEIEAIVAMVGAYESAHQRRRALRTYLASLNT